MRRLALLRCASLPFSTLSGLGGGVDPSLIAAVLEAGRGLDREAAELSDRLFEIAGPPHEDAERARARFAVLRIRRDIHNGKEPRSRDLEDAARLVPDATIAAVARYADHLEERRTAYGTYVASYAEWLARSRHALARFAAEPLVAHGIYLASRSLAPKVRGLARGDAEAWSHDERHTAAKLASYVSRFAAKTSPNGVFCSVAIAWIDGAAASVTGDAAPLRLEVLLSLAEARKVTACLAIDPSLARSIVPRPNPTLQVEDGGWTFWKPASPRHPTDTEVFSRVGDQSVLSAFLEEARPGLHETGALVAAVAARTGLDVDALTRFYEQLVVRGVLIGELEIPYSCRRRFRELAAAARGRGCDADWVSSLESIERAVDALPGKPHQERTDAMEAIVERIKALPRARPFKPDELFRVDAASSLDVTLPDGILTDLTRGVRVFVRLLEAMYPEALQHRRLVSRFLRDHPPDTDVPFLDLYRRFAENDEPRGGTPFEFPSPSPDPPSDPREREAWEAAVRVHDFWVRRAEESSPGDIVEIDEATAVALAGNRPEPRWAAGALFQVAARGADDVVPQRTPIVLSALFNGIGLALSRFAHLLGDGCADADNAVIAELKLAWSAMKRPGAELAELTYVHEARTANAGLRPVLFPYEIELPGDLVSRGLERISLADLSIRYDTASDRLVLRSIARGFDVIPVLSSGVSPSGIVSELIHIGRQGWQTIGYLPGFHAARIRRWPRVACGNVVLFRARWVFDLTTMPPVSREGVPFRDADFFLELARWRAAHAIPQHVFIHTQAEPKPYYVDLMSPILADLLRRTVTLASRDDGARLFVTEMFPAPDEHWVRDGRGSYASEFLVQLGGPSQPEPASS